MTNSKIKVLLETSVTGIDKTKRTIQIRKKGSETTSEMDYTQLVICTGAEPIRIFKEHRNLFYVRKIEDVREMGKFIS
eukprot:gnl/Chilomastix_caulleri/8572.p1 GENE.gnl/Chilomastix_caulleri/8572~~gnl/Chilomastix_caulleri/8572.p1  ORF type:complete len:78 (-),score=19.73 gnl/Chilomastix_caulleri/8572:155-388(-)